MGRLRIPYEVLLIPCTIRSVRSGKAWVEDPVLGSEDNSVPNPVEVSEMDVYDSIVHAARCVLVSALGF